MGRNIPAYVKRQADYGGHSSRILRRMYLFHKDSAYIAAASISETLFTKFFQGAARRAGITDISVLLLGFDTIALQSEKNLWDLSEWAKQSNTLGFYLKSNPAAKIAEDFKSSILSAEVSQEVWMEWKSRINAYFKEFGCTAYEFDFAYAHHRRCLRQPLNP